MTALEQRIAAKEFAADWKNRGDENQHTQLFWIELLRKVYGAATPEKDIEFEYPVKLRHLSYIDAYITDTHVLIEQKSITVDLNKPIKQSDGQLLTPYEQAHRYAANLPYSQKVRWIVVCNFKEFHVHDMENPTDDPVIIALADLEKEYDHLQFLVDSANKNIKKQMAVSLDAGELVGVLYAKLLAQYKDPKNPETLKSLNELCVRLVFCLYAEDSEIFGKKHMFHDYLQKYKNAARTALIELFKTLATKIEDRDPYIDADLGAFPYVNGGLFANEDIEIPTIDKEIVDLILKKASEDFDWSNISPTIFGAVFESTLNPETRRSGGMHYTSIENIHKVIDPLFLNDLKRELEEILIIKSINTRKKKLQAYQEKLAAQTFLDPACGSGNFLTETYLSLRRLENRAISALTKGQTLLDLGDPIKVSIAQFYGIEINDFAVTVARTALWIAESQMMKETESIVQRTLDFFPLKNYINVIESNALTCDWETVVPKEKVNYIMGNPPFVGYSLQNQEQKNDIRSVYTDENGKPYKTAGKIDYVAGWYFKASRFMQGTDIRTAFVSTNSITQGEQVAGVWKPLYERFCIHIDFAHRTFRWNSEVKSKAHVHCVIVGFSIAPFLKEKRIYTDDSFLEAENINAYLIDAPDVFIESNNKSVSNIPEMLKGSSPVDGGFFFLSDDERNKLIESEPLAPKYIRKFLGAKEYLHNINRWCLWLDRISPVEIKQMPIIRERIDAIRSFRSSSTKEATRKYADFPTKFMETRQPNSDYILIPRHSSENRTYIPLGFISSDIICGDANNMIPGATLYHFGVLTSSVHMAWVRTVCGRLKSDYRYSNDVVYNNFPWPAPAAEQTAKIEQTAKAILDARKSYPGSSLADLYDDSVMPPDLRKAHQANDKAVMQAYGFPAKMTEPECVAKLMQLYQKLAGKS